jgi:hypothetical protein
MPKDIADLLKNVAGIKRSRGVISRELVRVLEEVYSSTRGNVVYISSRGVVNKVQRVRRLSSCDRVLMRNLLSSTLSEVNARRVNESRGIYAVSRRDLALIISRLREMTNEQ